MLVFKLLRRYFLYVVVCLIACFHEQIPLHVARAVITVSSVMREMLVTILPFLLISFIATALRAIPRESAKLVGAVMSCVVVFNFLNILLSGVFGFSLLKDIEVCAVSIGQSSADYSAYFSLSLPQIVPVTWALCIGILVGVGNSFVQCVWLDHVIDFVHTCVQFFMKRFFIPMLPVFVAGFLLKMFKEGYVSMFLEHNMWTCIYMCAFLWGYIILLLFVLSDFRMQRVVQIVRNALPPVITAFSTMSSAAALPLSIQAAKDNTGDDVLAESVMPLTMNFHMLGDTIVIPIMMMMVLNMFAHPMPGIGGFCTFAILFVLNKFAGGGVPSGSIMVAVPILERYFGFDATMTGFIIAFYSVIDPIATSANVAANNLFVIFFSRIRNRLAKRL